jgi:uncharacterized protein YunC (DUF1805 family)
MQIKGNEFEAIAIPTSNTNILLIKARLGLLACGYIKMEIANKVGDVCAIVTGVKTNEDMLSAKVVAVSEEAAKLGVKENMTGQEALLLMS